MSIFNWFTSKPPVQTASVPDSSGLGHVDATVPLMPSDRLRVKQAPVPVSNAANRKNERLERRELLYAVVRDSMIRAGVLAASYKFKVLSLDAHGRQYLIMMDLANQSAGDTGRLADIEAMIAQAAKARHDILVTAVYWRVNEHVAAGALRTPANQPGSAAKPVPAEPVQQPPPTAVPAVKRAQPFEPLQQDEVVAFKRALAGTAPAAALSAPGQIVTSGRRNPAPPVEFEETQMIDPGDSASPLGGTQYGDLN
ncbi:hypothetical protein [Rhodoferax sp.]|uniref:hypothetical protein n=1 Tax=Rhodoferax sp. TaxID=50421 RepID=UPI001ED0BF26|nr:hypothetical protein [Rhodoferax sp.]MBT9505045.1 hypothetical protein [Rhodoferax sp.]